MKIQISQKKHAKRRPRPFFYVLLVLMSIGFGFVACGASNPQITVSPGKTYYVSKSGNGSDGKSWANAWNELAKINWSVVQPGDTILLDGGSQSMTYTTTLTIGKSGIQGAPITIKRATDSGHSGTVILFGGRAAPLPYCGQPSYTYRQASLADGIVFGSRSWIVIDGMSWSGIRIHGFSRYGVNMVDGPSNDTLRNMEIYDIGEAAQEGTSWNPETNGNGVELAGTNLTFSQMNIHDNSADDFNTGEAPGIRNVTITYSWLYVSREDPRQSGLPFNTCTHQDGYQIFDGGVQSNLLIENSILGSGMNTGVILGQTPGRAAVNNVTIRNSLLLNKHVNIMGYPNVRETGWVMDHDTIFTPGQGIAGGTFQSLFLQGSGNTVKDSIFYDGGIYLPDGLTGASGNCAWKTTGNTAALGGQAVDPQFITDVSSYNDRTPLATIMNADFTVRPGSPCAGKGSTITSLRRFLQIVGQANTGTTSPAPTQNPATVIMTEPQTNKTTEQHRASTAENRLFVWFVLAGGVFICAMVLLLLFYRKWRRSRLSR